MIKRISISILMVVAMAIVLWAQTPQFNAPAGSPVARHGALRVQGNKIVGSHGNPVALRGMSFFWNTTNWGGEKYYTAETVNWLIDNWKVDVVRVAIEPAQTSNQNWRTVVNAAVARGVYVIIDFHAHSHNLASQAETFFVGLRSTYGNRPHVIYEIFNEPCANSPGTNGGGGCTGEHWDNGGGDYRTGNHIRPYAQQVVSAVRGSGGNGTLDTNIIIIGTPNFSKRVDVASLNPVTGRNLAYAVHFYTGHVVTPTDPYGINSEHRERLRNWVRAALNNGVAVFASEFGVSQPGGGTASGENNSIDTVEANRWFEFLDQHHIGWANWSVNDKDEAASALRPGASVNGNWSDANLSASGRYIRGKLNYYATPITLSATSQGSGTVSVSPPGPYLPNQSVTLTAAPSAGARFEGWDGGGITGTAAMDLSTSITLTAATTVRGVFFEDNMITRGSSTFTVSSAGWSTANTSPAGAPTIERVNGELRVTMPTNAGSAPADVRVQHQNLSVTANRYYKLTFRARTASGTRTITPSFRGGSSMNASFVDAPPVTLTTTMPAQPFEVRFSATGTATSAILAFSCGGNAGNWFLDDVSLVEDGFMSVVPQVAAMRPFSAAFNGQALVLSGGGRVAEIAVYDMSGRLRLSEKAMLSDAGTRVSLSRLPAGVYTVRYKIDGRALGTNERIMLAK